VSAQTLRRPWHLAAVTEPLTDYRPVLALTLIRHVGGRTEVLVGARTEAANRTHPNVVSVPTLRVPVAVAAGWTGALTGALDEATGAGLRREVDNLLARKLGVADALELGRIGLREHVLRGWQGTSVIGDEDGPDGEPRTEDLTMFNACVEVTAGAELFPAGTASYAPLTWVGVVEFLEMVRSKEVAALNAGLDELLFCVYGLCLETSARLLAEQGWSCPTPR
jgi:hypothetical protein